MAITRFIREERESRKSLFKPARLFPTSPATSNVDHIVEAASGLRAAVNAASSLISIASSEAAAARAEIAALPPSPSPSPSVRPQIDEGDVAQEQERQVGIMLHTIPKFESPLLNSNMQVVADSLVRESRYTIMPLPRGPVIRAENKMVPDIDSVELRIRKGKGISDSFFTRIMISLPVDDVDSGKVKSIRVFRSESISDNLSRPLSDLSLHGMGVIASRPAAARSKNEDSMSQFARRLAADSVVNEVSLLNPIDRIIGKRISARRAPLRVTRPIDSSVADNPSFMDARRLQEPDFGLYAYDNVEIAGSVNAGDTDVGQAHADELSTDKSQFGMSVSRNNSAKFKQFFASKPSRFVSKKIGNRYYFTLDDESVVFGRRYQYYVTTVDGNMIQSNRSVIVPINVDGMRVPARPSEVVTSSDGYSVTLLATCDDQFVEKFEIWKKDNQESAAKDEFIVYRSDNGYSFIDEITNHDSGGGANWIDRSVIPGHTYFYRIYSVDVFGNKSESPFEISMTVPDIFDVDNKDLIRPTILAEIDSKTQKMKLTMRCPDKKVLRLRLERRDLTLRQGTFTTPSQSSRIIMGTGRIKHGSGLRGERVQDEDNISMWNGWFENTTDDIVFIDRLISLDHIYQYRICGFDDLGNRTSYGYSSPVLIHRKPMINVPVNLSSSFVTGTTGQIVGVMTSWQASSLDVSSEDKFGSQEALLDTSVRTLYQVERQEEGGRWLLFNMTSDQKLFDPVEGYSGSISPGFRPPFLKMNTQYNYRVQAVMSGGYISNKTQQISVYVGQSIATPANFTLKTPDARVNPFYVMLNWDTVPGTGVVDKWEIERVEVNNYAAARINLQSAADVANLNFQPYRVVFREASRFHVFWSDFIDRAFRSDIIVGQHHFMDSQIVFGNTYFYRIYAVDNRGNRSFPSYRGIRVTSSPYERLIEDVVSASERRNLTAVTTPLRLAPNILPPPPMDSMSLNPSFSTPRAVSTPKLTTRFGIIRGR